MRKFRGNVECDRTSNLGIPRLPARVLFALSVLLCAFTSPSAAAQPNAKRVLLLYSFSDRGANEATRIIESAMRAGIPQPIDFYVEYLEGRRLDDSEYEKELVGALGHTYSHAKLDLVLIESYTGLRFAAVHHDELFPGVPIVFLDVDPGQIAGQKMWPGVTGVTAETHVEETIELALHLHPDATTVAIVASDSTPDKFFLARMHAELLRHQGKVREVDLFGVPTNQILDKVATLSPQSIVFFQVVPRESQQPAMDSTQVLKLLATRFPTYSIFPGDILGYGGVGGIEYDWNPELALAVTEVRRVFAGTRPEDIPIAAVLNGKVTVDWRALQHWHIPESVLPPGTIILNRPPTIWQQYRNYILAAIGVTVLQTLIIVALLWQRARNRKAEAILRESETRFRVMADTTPSLIWMCDARGKISYLNEQRLAFTGPDPNAGYGDTWITFIHPDDVKGVLDALWQALKDQRPFTKEYRLRRNDGAYRWMYDVASPRINGDGSFAGFIGSAIDVTDQKLAQQALENVSGQLIEAQEKERARIARDLHDDICQRLALLSMELEQAKPTPNGSVSPVENLEEIRKHCSEIAGDVQSLSHQLHSSKLDYLGVSAAIRGFCKEFSIQHKVRVEFADRNVPQHLPKDISLCLFRVAQEALHNAVKYSGTTQFKVELGAIPDEVQLQVSDAGAGFDVEEVKKNRGLGLVSMQERTHLVHGTFTVESKLGVGTKIRARVPLVADQGLTSKSAKTILQR